MVCGECHLETLQTLIRIGMYKDNRLLKIQGVFFYDPGEQS